MRVAVIDVGSNTVRLLVAERDGSVISPVVERKARLGLGEEVERRGRISPAKLTEASLAVREMAREARELGSSLVEVVVASPGRQAENAGRLIRQLARSTAAPVRVLSADEEAVLAYRGALAFAGPQAASVVVCDVGGGSTQLAFGEPHRQPVWLSSVDIGSLRLSARLLDGDPAGKKAIAAARAAVRDEFDGVVVPLPKAALAVGGSARALRKLVGGTLGRDELGEAVSILRRKKRAEVAGRYEIDPGRVRTLAAGAVILAEVQRRLGIPLVVVKAGLREGLALSLLDEATSLRGTAEEIA